MSKREELGITMSSGVTTGETAILETGIASAQIRLELEEDRTSHNHFVSLSLIELNCLLASLI